VSHFGLLLSVVSVVLSVSFSVVASDLSHEPIEPLPQVTPGDKRVVALGKRLFHERKLSRTNEVSCATCHPISQGGADHLVTSIGINGKTGVINTPTVFNSHLNFRQFWDGRAKSLSQQMDGPLLNPIEMGNTWDNILATLHRDKTLVVEFNAAFRDGLTKGNIRASLVEYQRSLTTPDSPFDRWLRGDQSAISAEVKEGYRLFKVYGCSSCHQGRLAGANLYQKMGIVEDYFKDRGNITVADYGLFNVTGKEDDRFVFKVPSLRNVALTSPYLHDGSQQSLAQVVTIMGYYQLGRNIPESDASKIVAFLHSLTGLQPDL
jgi:cytochrome c peroxidase